jgi:predicted dehydrogenase
MNCLLWRVVLLMIKSAPIGIGVIGLGVGEQHAHSYAAHPDCRLVAVCDRNPAQLAAVSERLPVCQLYHYAEDLIDDPEVEVVSIASNDDCHYAQIVRALRSGKHVFSEKPLCLSTDELRVIRDAWRKASGLRLSTNTILRRSPRFRWLKDAVASGQFGTVYCIEADYVYGRLHKLTDGWRGQIPDYSVMLGGGIHMVDLLLWISAQQPAEVMAYGSGLASRATSFQGNDLVLALLQFESGLVAKVGANFASVHPHFHRLLVYGTEATFDNSPETPSASARLWESRKPEQPPQAIEAAYPGIGKGDLIPAFIDAVCGRGEPDISEDEVFATVSVCLAIDQSLREQRLIRMNFE